MSGERDCLNQMDFVLPVSGPFRFPREKCAGFRVGALCLRSGQDKSSERFLLVLGAVAGYCSAVCFGGFITNLEPILWNVIVFSFQ